MQSRAQPVTETTPAAIPLSTIARADLLAIGTRIGDDIFVGITRSGTEGAGDIALYLNLLLHENAPWDKAKALAAALATNDHPVGTYSLPTRKEQALLFANAAEHFEAAWYWSGEQYSANYAWMQNFSYGYQVSCHKDDGGRVRAVRRLVIQ
ncbi:MAG: hypothetical protein ING75_16975 [Rhodocyclaceae bacterium]|nr:hypothetical protein [Rhodocyclaceae bacterium]